jgi:hypothetical protein
LPFARARCAAFQTTSAASADPPGLSMRNTIAAISGSSAASSSACETVSDASTGEPLGVV